MYPANDRTSLLNLAPGLLRRRCLTPLCNGPAQCETAFRTKAQCPARIKTQTPSEEQLFPRPSPGPILSCCTMMLATRRNARFATIPRLILRDSATRTHLGVGITQLDSDVSHQLVLEPHSLHTRDRLYHRGFSVSYVSDRACSRSAHNN